MPLSHQLRTLAAYNAWMNQSLYAAAAKLTAQELLADHGAFFKSIIGTLNHIVVGDTIWLKRFAQHPAKFAALQRLEAIPQPTSLDQILFTDLNPLRERRERLDAIITDWTAALTDSELEQPLHYTNSKGVVFTKPFGLLALHLFNHQTHHRGQATTLLFQAGVDVGVTDLLALIPNV
jgi:uncharacterized damage-inducible protein DinB